MTGALDPDRLRAAAEAGDTAAALRLAALHANGIFVAQDWPAALLLLAQAAEAGEATAQQQISLLDDGAEASWRARAAQIDPNSWRKPPSSGALIGLTGVRPVKGLLAPAICRHIIAAGAAHLAGATVHVREGGVAARADERTNRSAFFSAATTDCVVAMAREKFAALMGLSTGRLEPASLLHYRVGETFAEHFDAFTPDFADGAAEMARLGQRSLTVIVYLNEDFEGGETSFPRIGVRYRGKTGDALAWSNAGPNRAVEPLSLHAGLAPTAGEKWVLSQWIRDRDCSAYWG